MSSRVELDDHTALRVAIDYLRRQAESLGFQQVASLLEEARRHLETAGLR